jgi:outer membrane cobalamin receptor
MLASPSSRRRFAAVRGARSPFLSAFTFSIVAFSGAASAASLTGTVTDPDGRPVRGAEVLAAGTLTSRTGTTDERGRYRIERLDAGHYEVRVLIQGFQSDVQTIALDADDAKDVPLKLRLSGISEAVVVTAAQVDAPLSMIADSVTVISRAELEGRQVETVGDALRLVPGVTVAQNGGRGSVTSLFSRGGESDFTLVLIDGMRANAFGGGYDFSQLPAGDIERIEVVRGPQSALYGSDAIGGVVQIITRHGGPPRAQGTFEAGTFGTTRATASASGSSESWSWSGAAERFRSDGFDGLALANGERVSNDDSDERHVSGGIGWTGEEGADLRLKARWTATERGFPGPFGSNPIGAFSGVDRVSRGHVDARQLGATFSRPWSRSLAGRVRQRAEVDLGDFDGHFVSAFGPSRGDTGRLTARTVSDVVLAPAFTLSAGVEFEREHGGSTFVTGLAGQPVPVRRSILGYFGEMRYQKSQRLFAVAGLRVEQIRRDALEGSSGTFSARPPFAAESIVSANPKIAVTYYLRSDGTRLRAGAGTGTRPPDVFEIAYTDNPSLKPERTRSLDAGVSQPLARGTIVLDVTAFLNRYDDLIVAVGAFREASRFKTDNISNAMTRGVELSGAFRTAWGLTARAAYTFLHSEILAVDRGRGQAPPPFVAGDPLLRRPRHHASIDLTVTRGRFRGFTTLTSRGRALDVEPSLGTFGGLFFNPGSTVLHAGAAVRLTPHVDLFARGMNLLDRRYEETLGYPALRRSAMGGVRVVTRR